MTVVPSIHTPEARLGARGGERLVGPGAPIAGEVSEP